MKYYHFRVSGSIELRMYVTEEDIREDATGIVPTEEARANFESEIEELIDKAHPCVGIKLDQVEFDRIEEAD